MDQVTSQILQDCTRHERDSGGNTSSWFAVSVSNVEVSGQYAVVFLDGSNPGDFRAKRGSIAIPRADDSTKYDYYNYDFKANRPLSVYVGLKAAEYISVGQGAYLCEP
jgi:hypothetical protein